LNYEKLITEQKRLILIEEQLNRMSWMRIKSELLKEWSRNMSLKINHVETVMNSSIVLQFAFKKRSRMSEYENQWCEHDFSCKLFRSYIKKHAYDMLIIEIIYINFFTFITCISFNLFIFFSLNNINIIQDDRIQLEETHFHTKHSCEQWEDTSSIQFRDRNEWNCSEH